MRNTASDADESAGARGYNSSKLPRYDKCSDAVRAMGVLSMNPLDTISGTIISGLVLAAILVVIIKAIVGV